MARKGGGPGDSGGGYAERQEYMPPTDPRLGPPPDLPSLLLHNRIVYLGMALVPAVTELVRVCVCVTCRAMDCFGRRAAVP